MFECVTGRAVEAAAVSRSVGEISEIESYIEHNPLTAPTLIRSMRENSGEFHMDKTVPGIDANWVEQIAATLQQYGFYGFAALSLAALVLFRTDDPKIRWVFVALFAGAAVISGFVFVAKPPPRIVGGSFGEFASGAEPRATSPDPNFYAALRYNNETVELKWLYIVPPQEQPLGADGFRFNFGEKIPMPKRDNNFNVVTEIIQLTNSFELPAASLTTGDKPPFFKWTRSFDRDKNGVQTICFEGQGLKEKLCGKNFGTSASRGDPAVEPPARHGSLGPAGWLHAAFFPAAAAQGVPVLLSGPELREALLSSDTRRWGQASRSIEKSPAIDAGLINDVLTQPIEANTYTSRLAIVTALRNRYKDLNLVYPDAASFGWMTPASWRRVVLDSFDRGDPLGDMSRRLLRVAKSPQSKAALDDTLAQLKSRGVLDPTSCLELLRQDLYVNWAMLSLENLKKSNKLTPATLAPLVELLEPIGFANGGAERELYRLRANYIEGAVMLEAATSMPAASAAERKALAQAGTAELSKISSAIGKFGLTPVQKRYPVNQLELGKATGYLALPNLTGGDPTAATVSMLRSDSEGQTPYPSCKL